MSWNKKRKLTPQGLQAGLGRVASARGVAVATRAARARAEGDFGGGLRTTGGDSRDLSGARDSAGRELAPELQRSPTCVISGR